MILRKNFLLANLVEFFKYNNLSDCFYIFYSFFPHHNKPHHKHNYLNFLLDKNILLFNINT